MSIYYFESIKAQYEQENNKPLKPISRKENLTYKIDCVFCGAPNNYLYNNNNDQQCLCKSCNNTFSSKTRHYDELTYYCPHCKNKLQVNHDRKNCIVYKCKSNICLYYLDSLERQKNDDPSLFFHVQVERSLDIAIEHLNSL